MENSPTAREESQVKAQKPREIRTWLGVTVDILLTLVLLVLGFDPAYEIISRHRHESAMALGMIHMIMVPAAILTALVRSEKLELFTDKPGFVRQTIEMMFILFYVFGWIMPTLVFAQRTNVPSWMIGGCIVAHVAPIIATIVLALFKRAMLMDQLALWLAHRWQPQAILYGVYLAGIEVFLFSARAHTHRFGPMPFFIWAGAYLPTRLLLAKISGLEGPERWTFLLTNIVLLVQLILGHSD